MSIKLMNAAWELQMPAGQKFVLVALCDQAGDSGDCFPSIATIARRCSMGERSVQRHIRDLEDAGYLERIERMGRSTIYRINPRQFGTPADLAPPPKTAKTPANLAPAPANLAPITITKPSLNRKGSIFSDDDFKLPDWINRSHWDAWHSCPKRKKATDAQKQLAVEKLAQWRAEGVDYAAALETAAIGGYQGLFKPESKQQKKTPQTAKYAAAAVSIFGKPDSQREVIDV